MDPILKKLMFKGQSPVLLVNAPAEFKTTAAKFGVPVDRKLHRALEENTVFWVAYPKGTSKNYKGVDINRDTGGARVGTHGFQGVAMVAIDEDWAAIRFKRTD